MGISIFILGVIAFLIIIAITNRKASSKHAAPLVRESHFKKEITQKTKEAKESLGVVSIDDYFMKQIKLASSRGHIHYVFGNYDWYRAINLYGDIKTIDFIKCVEIFAKENEFTFKDSSTWTSKVAADLYLEISWSE